MLTIENLKNAGADTEAGVARCAGNEEFYLKIVGMVLESEEFDLLREKIAEKDLPAAFERAHALKGLVGNASLDRIYEPVCRVTEHLRAGEDIDYAADLEEIFGELNALRELAAAD